MGQKTLRYGTLFAPCEGLDEGAGSVTAEEKRLVVKGKEDAFFNADPGFSVLKSLESRHV
jgi:hypothetical protein